MKQKQRQQVDLSSWTWSTRRRQEGSAMRASPRPAGQPIHDKKVPRRCVDSARRLVRPYIQSRADDDVDGGAAALGRAFSLLSVKVCRTEWSIIHSFIHDLSPCGGGRPIIKYDVPAVTYARSPRPIPHRARC